MHGFSDHGDGNDAWCMNREQGMSPYHVLHNYQSTAAPKLSDDFVRSVCPAPESGEGGIFVIE